MHNCQKFKTCCPFHRRQLYAKAPLHKQYWTRYALGTEYRYPPQLSKAKLKDAPISVIFFFYERLAYFAIPLNSWEQSLKFPQFPFIFFLNGWLTLSDRESPGKSQPWQLHSSRCSSRPMAADFRRMSLFVERREIDFWLILRIVNFRPHAVLQYLACRLGASTTNWKRFLTMP